MNTFFLILIIVLNVRVFYLYHVDKMSEEGITICAAIMLVGAIILYHFGCGA